MISRQEEKSTNEYFDQHIDGQDACCSRHVVSQNDDYHKSFQFIRLIAMHDSSKLAVIREEKPDLKHKSKLIEDSHHSQLQLTAQK